MPGIGSWGFWGAIAFYLFFILVYVILPFAVIYGVYRLIWRMIKLVRGSVEKRNNR